MNVDVEFVQKDEQFLIIRTKDFGIDQEMSEYFSFFVDGYKFTPKFRSGQWDGKIRIFDLRTKKLPKGLLKIAVRFCKDRNYTFQIDPDLNPKTNISIGDIEDFVDSIDVTTRGKNISVRDYQLRAIIQQLSYYRNLLISPTSSGKSLILYYKLRYHIDVLQHRCVLIVPTTQLVEQMYSDFKDYSSENGWDVDDNVQLLYSGKEKFFSKNLMISTWQSLAAMSKHNPDKFQHICDTTDLLAMDEAHQFKSDVTMSTANKFYRAKWRTGTTGTLDDSKINKLQLIGLMSEPFQVITTRELMDQNSVVQLDIKVCKLQYPNWLKDQLIGMDYKAEINYLVTYEPRNKFIADLAKNTKGVTLVLYTYIEKHGAVLFELIKQRCPNRTVKFIHGGVDVDEREEVRRVADEDPECIIIASSAIFSTGTNIPAIENVIFAMPTKQTIRVRQSIGRGLRLRAGKKKCTLFDVGDDLQFKSYTNTTLRHMFSRIEIYEKEQFDFTVHSIDISKFIE